MSRNSDSAKQPQMYNYIIHSLLSSLGVSRTGSASDWCKLQEALSKCINTIQYNTIHNLANFG